MDPKEMWDFVKCAIANIAFLVVSKLLGLALTIASIAIGAKYLQDCPQQHYIPIYLLVCGVFGLFMALVACLPCTRNSEGGSATWSSICSVWNGLVSAFMFCWLISGSVWIYSIYPPNYNQTMAEVPYCNETLYKFAFWTTTLGYIVLGVVLLIGCCLLGCTCICAICINMCRANEGTVDRAQDGNETL